jgi:hypothetical protein
MSNVTTKSAFMQTHGKRLAECKAAEHDATTARKNTLLAMAGDISSVLGTIHGVKDDGAIRKPSKDTTAKSLQFVCDISEKAGQTLNLSDNQREAGAHKREAYKARRSAWIRVLNERGAAALDSWSASAISASFKVDSDDPSPPAQCPVREALKALRESTNDATIYSARKASIAKAIMEYAKNPDKYQIACVKAEVA